MITELQAHWNFKCGKSVEMLAGRGIQILAAFAKNLERRSFAPKEKTPALVTLAFNSVPPSIFAAVESGATEEEA